MVRSRFFLFTRVVNLVKRDLSRRSSLRMAILVEGLHFVMGTLQLEMW